MFSSKFNKIFKKDKFRLKKILSFLNQRLILFKKIFPLLNLLIANKITKYPKVITNFEYLFKKYIGIDYSLTFSNGTSAFDSIIFALNLKKGDKVLLSQLSFSSVVLTCLQNNLDLVFFDVDSNLNIILPKQLTDKSVKAILITHVFGIPQNMQIIKDFAEKYNLKIIEDCSHAHGAEFKGKKVGNYSDAAFFSLQGDKAIAAGEGGIAVTKNKRIFDLMRLYSHFGRDMKDIKDVDPIFKRIGYGRKSRMHPLAASLAIVDLKTLDKRNDKLRKKFLKFSNFIKRFEAIYPVEISELCKLGGFHHGAPFWIISENYQEIRNSLLQCKKLKVLPVPYINYQEYSVFNSHKDFQNVIRNNKSDLVKYRDLSVNIEKNNIQNRLLFISLQSLRIFGKEEKEELNSLLTCL